MRKISILQQFEAFLRTHINCWNALYPTYLWIIWTVCVITIMTVWDIGGHKYHDRIGHYNYDIVPLRKSCPLRLPNIISSSFRSGHITSKISRLVELKKRCPLPDHYFKLLANWKVLKILIEWNETRQTLKVALFHFWPANLTALQQQRKINTQRSLRFKESLCNQNDIVSNSTQK